MKKDPLQFNYCILPNSTLDMTLKSFGYPAWTKQNCEEFLRFQIPKNCSASLTVGNIINETARNFTGDLHMQNICNTTK